MEQFLTNNFDDLIARCIAKVAQRPQRSATPEQLANGVPSFLRQLIRTLRADVSGEVGESRRISGASGGVEPTAVTEMGVSAAAHGKQLLELGFSIDQVVHDYGDLCQAITDLAVERDAPFSINEFRTLNRCLDNAIASAVTEFSRQRDVEIAIKQSAAGNERFGLLVHELRNALHTASLAFAALESGHLPIGGATSSVLKNSLQAMTVIVRRTVEEVRSSNAELRSPQAFTLHSLILDASSAAQLHAREAGSLLEVAAVDPSLAVSGSRELLLAALMNLLQNAFKFTHAGTQVALNAYAREDRILIDVVDHCGGLPPGSVERMFEPFAQRGRNKSGLGLGLSIARQYVEADGGTLSVRDVPGTGCVFTIGLPRYAPR